MFLDILFYLSLREFRLQESVLLFAGKLLCEFNDSFIVKYVVQTFLSVRSGDFELGSVTTQLKFSSSQRARASRTSKHSRCAFPDSQTAPHRFSFLPTCSSA